MSFEKKCSTPRPEEDEFDSLYQVSLRNYTYIIRREPRAALNEREHLRPTRHPKLSCSRHQSHLNDHFVSEMFSPKMW